jgi:3-oxoacyl-(acyl-carrier-protein) synthase
MGVVSPVGIGVEAWQQALGKPEHVAERAFNSPSFLDTDTMPAARVAEVWGFDPKHWLGPRGHRNLDRLTKFLIVAAKHALEHAGLKSEGEFTSLPAERVGICSATAYGSLDAITELNRVAELEEPRYINPTRFPNTVINAAAGYVSIWEGLKAPNTTIVDGNCGALDAVLSCETHLAHGRGDAFLVGGGEVLNEPLYLAFRKLGALAEDVDASRRASGLNLGEGSAYLCVEREHEARSRGADVHARLAGYGSAFEPPCSEALLVHGASDAVARAIRGALGDAGVDAADVDAVCASFGGLSDIDAAEHRGIAEVFGEDIALAAPKQMLGESFGAAGALGMAAAVAWMHGAPVVPLVAGTRPERLDTVVVTTVGFYGNVSAVVMRRPS